MLRYEALFLVVPEITTDEANTIESQLEKIINDSKGNVISYDRWGKYKLAYPVRKYDYGIYYLVRFEVNNENKAQLLESLRTLFAVKYIDLIMRYFISRLDINAPLEYKRPDSLEDTPTRDVDTFLKENKMSGLIGKNSSQVAEPLDIEEQVEH